jgi:hypothetical protein
MKRYILGGIAVLAIAIVITINVNINSQRNSNLSNLSLANVEALTAEIANGGTLPGIELTYFNGTWWNNMDTHWFGSAWRPVLISCGGSSTTGGSISIGYMGASISVPTGTTTSSWSGQMIQCQGGNGNCFNGTSCIG